MFLPLCHLCEDRGKITFFENFLVNFKKKSNHLITV